MIQGLMLFGALSAATAVMLGAFGAHALKSQLTSSSLSAFETGVQYQMTHSLGVLIVGVLMLTLGAKPAWLVSAFSFSFGVICFSGSLYGLALFGWRWLGPVTPIGGVFFIAGWIALAVGLWQSINPDP